jgi:large subunit ribosomal protein L20
LFITRVSAGCKREGVSYSVFMFELKKLSVQLNRKMLSQLAIFEPKAFSTLVAMTKK